MVPGRRIKGSADREESATPPGRWLLGVFTVAALTALALAPGAVLHKSAQEHGHALPTHTPPTAGPGKITKQIVMTSAHSDPSQLSPMLQANLNKTLLLNPNYKLRWLGDRECEEFIRLNFKKDVRRLFAEEPRGSYRGDICRACILSVEGGFYLDLDLELKVPLSKFAGPNTTFMSAMTASSPDRSVLNAVMGAEPGNAVLNETIVELLRWRAEGGHEGWMGPITLSNALRTVIGRECNQPATARQALPSRLEWRCGRETVRLYQEDHLDCFGQPTPECPLARLNSNFEGIRYGIFSPWPEHEIVAWPRFAACRDWGCNAGGWETRHA